MLTIEGKAKRSGVAIAVAAVVDATNGINGVSPALLAEGLAALKKMLAPQDYPEAIVVCDMLAMGVSIRIPGVHTIGIAAQSDMDVPGLEPDAPCVIGIADLMQSVSEGDIVIVDGNAGVIHIDPDPRTIVNYQEMEDRHTAAHVVYIASEHIPARTQDGDIVIVHARVTEEGDLEKALEEGADALIVEIRGEDAGPSCEAVLTGAAGKPVSFAVDFVAREMYYAAMRFAAPGQVTLLFELSEFDTRSTEAGELLDIVTTEAFFKELDPPQVTFGAHARVEGLAQADVDGDPAAYVVDLRKSPYLDSLRGELARQVTVWLGGRKPEEVVFVLGSHVDAVADMVRAGARSLAVAPELVGAAKYVIRSIGEEEEER